MGHVNKLLKGTRSATGAVVMGPNPDYTNGRANGSYVGAAAYTRKTAAITIGGTATVQVQGTNGDPTVAGDWRTLSEYTASGEWATDDAWNHLRFNVSAWTSGDVTVEAALQ